MDTSAPQTFTITVTPVNDAPMLTNATITYSTVGNTQLHVQGATLPGLASVSDASGALLKAVVSDIDGPAAPVVVAQTNVDTGEGTLTINADGSFTYVPDAGFTGIDTFTVQVTDTVTPVNLTVNITVGELVWYVNNQTGPNNAAGGDGRSTDAWETLAEAQAGLRTPNSTIFIFNGLTATTPLSGSIALKTGQKLLGEGVGLTVGGLPDARAGRHAAAHRRDRRRRHRDRQHRQRRSHRRRDPGPEPREHDRQRHRGELGERAEPGRAHQREHRVGFRAGWHHHPRGVDGDGHAGHPRQRHHGGRQRAADRAQQHGHRLHHGVPQQRRVRRHGRVGHRRHRPERDLRRHAGAGRWTRWPEARRSSARRATAWASPGCCSHRVSGALDFTDLDIVSGNGAALSVVGTGAFTGAAGTRITATAGAASLAATGGPAASLSDLTTDLQLGGLSSANSTGNGVSLTNVAGTFTAPTTATITNATTADFNVSGGAATVTYNGTITDDAGQLVSIANTTGGAKSFTGAITDGNDGDGNGISLTSNTGATITFSGGLLALDRRERRLHRDRRRHRQRLRREPVQSGRNGRAGQHDHDHDRHRAQRRQHHDRRRRPGVPQHLGQRRAERHHP